ncbi:hypothetical protein SEUCBS140593_009950 [Sporothrix eucalyptigena]|uniref:Uncharacterized protein n=1 Tax=Sporothrix eucalyptigena TaxID=1812306 RepID=A0ABP0D057_9PEZI
MNITAADYHYTMYTDGTGYLNVIHDTDGGGDNTNNATASALRKRHDGLGFKYNRKRYVFNAAAYGADVGTLGIVLAPGIAVDWVYDADYFLSDEWISAVGVDFILLQVMGVAIRIIAEVDEFGEEYEDVGICGDMVRAVHDELDR